MDNVHIIFIIISIGAAVIYSSIILYQIVGLVRVNFRSNKETSDVKHGISVIIPFRNESENIKKLQAILNSLKGADENCEFIWVDDHSEDDGNNMIDESSTINHRIIGSKGIGKKQAIKSGVQESNYNIIATIDADVSITKFWLQEVRNFFSDKHKSFLILPVLTHGEKGIWGNFEALDVLSLTGTTFSWASLGEPIMCNGANMAFRRNLFLQNRIEPDDENLVSGDDLFFLHQIKKHSKNAIGFSVEKSAQAHVNAFNNFSALVNQRVRWISKNSAYNDNSIKWLSICVVQMYIAILLFGLGSFFSPSLIKLFGILFSIKFFVDFLYLFLLARKFDKLDIMLWYPIAAVLQFVFIPFVFIKAKMTNFNWKGREYNR